MAAAPSQGFSDAWATATVVSAGKDGCYVEYSKFVDGSGKQLREKVSHERMRHVPLFPASFNVSAGL